MAARVTGSRSRRSACWPVGRPSVCVEWARAKRKMWVLGETGVLEWSRALDHVRGERKVGLELGELGVEVRSGEDSEARAEGERVPM